MKNLKDDLKKGLVGLLATAFLTATVAVSDYKTKHPSFPYGYKIVESQNIPSNKQAYKKVKSVNHESVSVNYMMTMLHWFDPQVISTINFDDSSSVKVRYSLWDNCLYLKREIVSPNVGDSCVIENSYLKVMK